MPNFRWLRSSFAGGLIDQGIVSLGNFGLNIVLARSFSERDYGAFSVILSFAFFLNTLHQAYVVYPLSVFGARAEAARFSYLLAVAATLTFAGSLLFFPVLAGAVYSVRYFALLPMACAFLLTWQLQEVYRRGLLAHARLGATIGNDVARYIVPLVGAVVLARLSLLSLQTVFLLLIAASLATCWALLLPLVRQLGTVLQNTGRELHGHWRLAAPILGANLLAAFSVQWFLWLLAWSHDLSSSATLVALANIVAFSSPVMFGMENILVPEIARRRDDLTFRQLMNLLKRRGLACGALVLPLFLIVFIWPGPVLHLFYGDRNSYAQFTIALRILAATYATYLAGYIFSATLRGYHATGAVFKMQLYPALFGITLGSWLTLRFGVDGACFAALLAGVLRASIGYYFVNRLREAIIVNPKSMNVTL